MVVVASNIVAPPLRERNRGSTSTEHSKRQDEQARQTSAIKGTSNEVRVVLEDARAVVAQVELGVETDNGPAEQDAGLGLVVGNVTSVLDKLREVDFADGEVSDAGNELVGC